jgi:Bacterial nucleoid DNA-binding protein
VPYLYALLIAKTNNIMSLHYVVRKKRNGIDPSKSEKYYLIQKSLGRLGKKELVEDMVKHTSTTKQEAQSAIEYLFEAIPRLIQLGFTVHYEGIGYFCTTIQSEGCDTPEEANAVKKKAVKLHFRPCSKLKKEINSIPIHPYPKIKKNPQQELLKKQRIEKNGKEKALEIAKKGLEKGLDIELIAELTGLMKEEIQ